MNSKFLKAKYNMKNCWLTATDCMLSFKGWRVPVEASWLRAESRWQEDCGKNGKSFDMSATSHSQEASANMRSEHTQELVTNWNLESWREIPQGQSVLRQKQTSKRTSFKQFMSSNMLPALFRPLLWFTIYAFGQDLRTHMSNPIK